MEKSWRQEFQFMLITTKECTACGPYKKFLDYAEIPYTEVDAGTSEGRRFCAAHKIQGAPNLMIMQGGKYVGNIPGRVPTYEMLGKELRKLGAIV